MPSCGDTFLQLERGARRARGGDHAAGRGFCSGGSVHDIIGPLFEMDAAAAWPFTRMTGALIGAIRALRKPVVAATMEWPRRGRGVALACDFRVMSEKAKISFLFVKVGLGAADMGAA